jgi:hypothetical protein
MASMDKLSQQLIEVAERVADVNDAAKGRGLRHRGTPTRWVMLPALGAGLYALGTRVSISRHAKSVLDQAKDRASDLPQDLLGRVQETTGETNRRSKTSSSGRSNGNRPKSRARSTSRKKTTARR